MYVVSAVNRELKENKLNKNYSLDNIIYQKLIQIIVEALNNTESTQLKIENFLFDQSKVILEENMQIAVSKNKDINYTKLGTFPNVYKVLMDKIPMIESFLDGILNKNLILVKELYKDKNKNALPPKEKNTLTLKRSNLIKNKLY